MNESHVERNNETETVNQNMVDSTNMDNCTLKEDEDHIILAGQISFKFQNRIIYYIISMY